MESHFAGAEPAAATPPEGNGATSTVSNPNDRGEIAADRMAEGALRRSNTLAPRGRRDFSDVRLHTDTRAAQSSRDMNARAFTLGNNIVFGAGEYAPRSTAGRGLLAHELAHVLQNGSLGGTRMTGATSPHILRQVKDAEAETEAEQGPLLQAPTAPPELIPPGGQDVGKVGIVAWDGEPELRLRPAPDTASEAITTLPFNTHIQVIKSFPGGWYFVSTPDGDLGYVATMYVRTNLPEPQALLHRVDAGVSGTAIAIAERYYWQHADDWGQDLRFYINALAWANNIAVPNTADGWKQVQFKAGQFIWVPSHEFAISLRGVVNSGSVSFEFFDALGLASFIERVGQLWEDLKRAIYLSGQYLWDALLQHMVKALVEVLFSLVQTLVLAAGIIALTTAIGAGLGALAGGAGAVPGAAAGFKAGIVLLEWLGLAMLVVWIGQTLVEVGSAFATFFGTVWDARGDEKKLDQAAREFAEAIAILMEKVLQGIVLLAAGWGLKQGSAALAKSKVGKAMGETKGGEWLSERVAEVRRGDTPIPQAARVARALLPRRARIEMLRSEPSHPNASSVRNLAESMQRHAQEVYQSLLDRTATSPQAQTAYRAIDANRDWSGAAFGRAFEAEMQLRLGPQNPTLVYQRQVAVPGANLPNRQPGGRPDWRLPIGNGQEAVFDATMLAGPSQGKALTKYGAGWNRFIVEILYPRPPHVGDVPASMIPTPPIPDLSGEEESEQE